MTEIGKDKMRAANMVAFKALSKFSEGVEYLLAVIHRILQIWLKKKYWVISMENKPEKCV